MSDNKNTEVSSEALERSITNWQRGIGGYVSVVVIIYFGWFLFHRSDISLDPQHWGQLGDFMGGLLNPVVALAAFFWLTKGVRIQNVELVAAQTALAAASVAQQKQAEHSLLSVRIDAISSIVNALTSDISIRREHLAFLMSQKINPSAPFYVSMRGKQLYSDKFDELVGRLNSGIERRKKRRVILVAELQRLLNASTTAAERAVFDGVSVETEEDDEG